MQKCMKMIIDDLFRDEKLHLKSIYDANIQNISLQSVELLNEMKKKKKTG